MSDFIIERVHCCVCDGAGKVRNFHFFKRDCHVCGGTGQRRILVPVNLTLKDADWARMVAIMGGGET
jgi:DnaJ-class molecular chaperone